METTFASRVLEFRKFKGLSQAAFAEQCGLEQGNITQMERGTEPKQSNVAKIVSGFPDLSSDWLLLGTGSMLREGRNLTPFVPGGEVNKQGATVLQPGSLAKALPLANMEEVGEEHRPAAEPAPTATNAKEFIAGLLREIDGHKEEKENLRNQLDKVYRALEESQRSNRVCQEQLSLLLGKSSGNQYAPGMTTMQLLLDEPAQAEPAEETCTIYPMFTTPAPHRRVHRVVAQAS